MEDLQFHMKKPNRTPSLMVIPTIPTHARTCSCCTSAGGGTCRYLHLLRQIETNRTERIKPQQDASWLQHHHSMVPDACVRWKRHEVISTTRKPGCASLCLKARPRWHPLGYKKKSGHAAELNQSADRIAMAAKRLIFFSVSPQTRRARLVRESTTKPAKSPECSASHCICRWRRTDRGNEEETIDSGRALFFVRKSGRRVEKTSE
jgi:hypothetical protein